MTDYAEHVVKAKAFMKDAEEALGRKEWHRSVVLLGQAQREIGRALEWAATAEELSARA